MLQRVLRLGFHVLLLDIDIVVLRNPCTYFQSLPWCVFSFYDQTLHVIEGQNKWVKRSQPLGEIIINTGVMLFKRTKTTTSLVSDFIKAPIVKGWDDQLLFNTFMNERVYSRQPGSRKFGNMTTACGRWLDMSVRMLSPVFFGTWLDNHQSNISDFTLETPYMLHFNWLNGFDAKKRKMVENGHWFVE